MRWVDGLVGGLKSTLPVGTPLVVTALLAAHGGAVTLRTIAVVVLTFGIVTAAQIAMAFTRPASLEIRRKPGLGAQGQPLIDIIGLIAFLAFLISWLAFLPTDAARLHVLPPPPRWAQGLGLLFAIIGCALGQLAVWQNEFASPAIQSHSGHTVVSTGAYGVVRHPLYSANLLYFAGLSLWIGSLAGLLGVAVILAATLARIQIEERHLRAELPGYVDYSRAVRARLIPFIL